MTGLSGVNVPSVVVEVEEQGEEIVMVEIHVLVNRQSTLTAILIHVLKVYTKVAIHAYTVEPFYNGHHWARLKCPL